MQVLLFMQLTFDDAEPDDGSVHSEDIEPWYALCLDLAPPDGDAAAADEPYSWQQQFPYDLRFLTDITFVPVADLVCTVPVLPVLPGHRIVVEGPPNQLELSAPVFVLTTIV